MSNTIKIQKPGFFILELLIAMAIMAIVWLIIARYHGVSIQSIHSVRQRMRALNIASSLLDKAVRERHVFAVTQKEIDGFTVTWKMHQRIKIPIHFNDSASHNIPSCTLCTIQVTWMIHNHGESVRLTSAFVSNKESL